MTQSILCTGAGSGGRRWRTGTRAALIGVLLVSLVLAGCRSTDSYWSFPTVRDLGENGLLVVKGLGGLSSDSSSCSCSKEGAYAMLFVLAFFITSPIWEPILRLGIDVALLPVTGAHDLWLYCRKDGEARRWPGRERRDRSLDSYWPDDDGESDSYEPVWRNTEDD